MITLHHDGQLLTASHEPRQTTAPHANSSPSNDTCKDLISEGSKGRGMSRIIILVKCKELRKNIVGRRYDDQGDGDDEGIDASCRNSVAAHQRRHASMVIIICLFDVAC